VFTVTATDTSGNTAVANVSYSVLPPPDTTDPTITINTPVNGANVVLGSSVVPDFSCADEAGGSGLASCVPSALDTATVGTKAFTVTAADNAGNTAERTVSYNVTYQQSGFLGGSIDTNVTNLAKAGNNIPVKWRLVDGNGTPISNPASFLSVTSAGTPCNSNEPTDAIEEYAAGGSGLQYIGDGTWQFNWKSVKSYTGTCRIVSLNLADGTHATAKFQFK